MSACHDHMNIHTNMYTTYIFFVYWRRIFTHSKRNNKENVDLKKKTLRYQKHSCCIHFTLAHISYRHKQNLKILMKYPKLEQMLLHCRIFFFPFLRYLILFKSFSNTLAGASYFLYLMLFCWRPPRESQSTSKVFIFSFSTNIIRWDFPFLYSLLYSYIL